MNSNVSDSFKTFKQGNKRFHVICTLKKLERTNLRCWIPRWKRSATCSYEILELSEYKSGWRIRYKYEYWDINSCCHWPKICGLNINWHSLVIHEDSWRRLFKIWWSMMRLERKLITTYFPVVLVLHDFTYILPKTTIKTKIIRQVVQLYLLPFTPNNTSLSS